MYNQHSRHNISPDQRTYLIGKRYKEEIKAEGRPKIEQKLNHSDPVKVDKSTAQEIAEQSNEERRQLNALKSTQKQLIGSQKI